MPIEADGPLSEVTKPTLISACAAVAANRVAINTETIRLTMVTDFPSIKGRIDGGSRAAGAQFRARPLAGTSNPPHEQIILSL
jgi:hypothetical protein